MISMEELKEKIGGVFYFATVENGEPRVRPFGFAMVFEDRLCLLYTSYDGLSQVVSSVTVCALGAVLVAVVVYAILVYAMKIITWYDCQLLPKGELIARLLRVTPQKAEN